MPSRPGAGEARPGKTGAPRRRGQHTRLGSGEADGDYARLELHAARSGTVTALEVARGRYIEANDKLFTVADLSALR